MLPDVEGSIQRAKKRILLKDVTGSECVLERPADYMRYSDDALKLLFAVSTYLKTLIKITDLRLKGE